MTAIILAAIVVVACAATGVVVRWLRRDSASLKRYHEAIQVLHDASDAGAKANGVPPDHRSVPSTSHVRVLRGATERSIPPLMSHVAAPLVSTPADPDGEGPTVVAPPPVSVSPPVSPPPGAPGIPAPRAFPVAGTRAHRRRRRVEPRRVGRRSADRRWAVVGAGTVAVAVGTVVSIVLVGQSGPGGRPPRQPTHVASAPSTTVTPTMTVAPRPSLLVATSSGPGTETYTVSSNDVTLSMVATRPCWIELRSGTDTGQVVFAGTLAPGEPRQFVESSGVWLRLGFPPGVTLQLDGESVGLPASASPLDVSVVRA